MYNVGPLNPPILVQLHAGSAPVVLLRTVIVHRSAVFAKRVAVYHQQVGSFCTEYVFVSVCVVIWKQINVIFT